jgi:catechol 2,3-dioxygenase-like lactoylglutathione lyase family enzyme
MKLGNFSVSLAVKDLAASLAFYKKLDFEQIAGDPTKNFVILRNGDAIVGLFQGMFDRNMLTFNPGWSNTAEALPDFQDVREIQRTLKGRSITPVKEANESTTGPDSVMLIDPDGNPILIDQHVDSPPDLMNRLKRA